MGAVGVAGAGRSTDRMRADSHLPVSPPAKTSTRSPARARGAGPAKVRAAVVTEIGGSVRPRTGYRRFHALRACNGASVSKVWGKVSFSGTEAIFRPCGRSTSSGAAAMSSMSRLRTVVAASAGRAAWPSRRPRAASACGSSLVGKAPSAHSRFTFQASTCSAPAWASSSAMPGSPTARLVQPAKGARPAMRTPDNPSVIRRRMAEWRKASGSPMSGGVAGLPQPQAPSQPQAQRSALMPRPPIPAPAVRVRESWDHRRIPAPLPLPGGSGQGSIRPDRACHSAGTAAA